MFDELQQDEALRRQTIAEQFCVNGDAELARAIDERGELLTFAAGQGFIVQGDPTSEVFFILDGFCEVVVDDEVVAQRGPRNYIGEMAAIQPGQLRTATCVATEDMVVIRVTGADFRELADDHPRLYKVIAQDLTARLGGGN
jgi:CRP-like cAMP-binding protein